MIRKAKLDDLAVVAELACCLWPHHTPAELSVELAQTLEKPDAAFFLALDGESAIGFAQCQLRRDYVEGTDSAPVGYLEGIYVDPGYRNQGVARGLLAACEQWAGACGCSEFASDCELQNTQSLRFHLDVGFEEANRIICFVKKL